MHATSCSASSSMNSITIEVVRRINESWGLVVAGEGECCFIDHVEPGSPAFDAGLQSGDFLLSVNGVDVSEASHDYVALLIRESGKIIRLKIIPNASTLQNSITAQYEEPFWTNEDPLVLYNSASLNATENDFEDDDDHTKFTFTADFEKYCKMFENGAEAKQEVEKPKHRKDVTKRITSTSRSKFKDNQHDDTESIEQSQFVVTREHQKDFDQNFVPDCTFQGRKASVAGAFTGDHNQILGEDLDDVRGIRARVEAGIQHFSFGDEQDRIKPEDKGKIILYTTSLRINRAISQRCDQVRSIFKGFRVKFEDRDIYNSPEHKDELFQRLGLKDGDPFPNLPRVYLDGVYVGGTEEVQAMSDCGDLRIRLKEFSKFNLRSSCPTCDGTGLVKCHSCNGQTFRKKNRFAVLKCGTCRQKGTLTCPDCL